MQKSVCPKPLASLIRIANAKAAFDNAVGNDQLAMRQAFINVCRAVKADGNSQRAAELLSDAVQVRMVFSRYGVVPTPEEIVRILQWKFIGKSSLPWPQEEFDAVSLLIEYDGLTTDRVKFCKVCSRIFWAKRITTEYCERQQCLETYKKRRYRKKLETK